MGGGGGDDAPAASAPAPAASGETAPATTAAAAPAVAQAAAPPVVAAPTPPWVQAAQSRKKIPYWAVPVLFLLPVWAILYALTLDPPTNANGPIAVGATTFSTNCAACHGAGGGGTGNIPALIGATAATKEFPDPAQQVAWVALGSAGWLQAGNKTLPGGRAVAGGMPAWAAALTPDELMAVVLHERATLNNEKFDYATWSKDFEATMKKYVPTQADAYVKVLEEWKTTPPA
jgi:mono/diheme cytochrome c family protein